MKDEKIFPELEESHFNEFVSKEDWMPIPSFGVKKREDIQKSIDPHISFRLEEGKVKTDVFFNGKDAVEKFCNILLEVSTVQKNKLVQCLKTLDKRYRYELLYTVKMNLSPSKWEKVHSSRCNKLSQSDIDNLLQEINALKNRRDSKQKSLSQGYIATLAVKLASIEIQESDDEQIKDTFTKLANILKIATDIKSNTEVRKLKRDEEKAKKAKEIALKKAKDCEDYRKKAGCRTDDVEECKKCPHNWQKYV